jgi:hypothetical protein
MTFDTNNYKVYTWKNWMMLHWILNPGLAINELLFGQRVPKISLEDKTLNKPRFERSFVPCPHCHTLHDSRTWSAQNGTHFQNWFGLYCKDCGQVIPCLMNGLTFIVLTLTFPLWGWYRKSLKKKWLAKQPQRYQNIDIEQVENPFFGRKWMINGISWGLFMYLIMAILVPLAEGSSITLSKTSLELLFWTIGGLWYGYIVKLITNDSGTKQIKINQQ